MTYRNISEPFWTFRIFILRKSLNQKNERLFFATKSSRPKCQVAREFHWPSTNSSEISGSNGLTHRTHNISNLGWVVESYSLLLMANQHNHQRPFFYVEDWPWHPWRIACADGHVLARPKGEGQEQKEATIPLPYPHEKWFETMCIQ